MVAAGDTYLGSLLSYDKPRRFTINCLSPPVSILLSSFGKRRLVFMTNHIIANELYADEFEDIVAAYRKGEGNANIRAACQGEVSAVLVFAVFAVFAVVGGCGGGSSDFYPSFSALRISTGSTNGSRFPTAQRRAHTVLRRQSEAHSSAFAGGRFGSIATWFPALIPLLRVGLVLLLPPLPARAQRAQNNLPVREASVGNTSDIRYLDWHGDPDIAEYITDPNGHDPFTVDNYCEEAILDRRGSLLLSW